MIAAVATLILGLSDAHFHRFQSSLTFNRTGGLSPVSLKTCGWRLVETRDQDTYAGEERHCAVRSHPPQVLDDRATHRSVLVVLAEEAQLLRESGSAG
jgi:hypothetical protein